MPADCYSEGHQLLGPGAHLELRKTSMLVKLNTDVQQAYVVICQLCRKSYHGRKVCNKIVAKHHTCPIGKAVPDVSGTEELCALAVLAGAVVVWDGWLDVAGAAVV